MMEKLVLIILMGKFTIDEKGLISLTLVILQEHII